MSKNIAIMGSSGGSGKDTVANMIEEELDSRMNRTYIDTNLAKGIYDICDKLADKFDRHELQAVGESMRSIFGLGVWIKQTNKIVDKMNATDTGVIITDIRKLLEFSYYVNEKEFLPIYVKCSPEVARMRLLDRDGSYNESDLNNKLETQLGFIEKLPTKIVGDHGLLKVVDEGSFKNLYIINNSYDIEQTQSQINDWLKEVFHG